jgi:3-oxoacyl-[acyl-carrier-protein] synthase-1
MNRVVITGIGIYSSIGKNLEEVKNSLYIGKSGIVLDEERKSYGYQSGLTGKLERPNLKGILDRRARVCMPEHAEFAYISTVEAMKNANLSAEYFDEHEVGIIFGNDSSTPAVILSADIIREKRDTSLVGSGAVFQSMNSSVTMNLSVIFHLRGINFTLSGACASGSHAIGMGYHMVRHGYQDCVVCGGSQEVNLFCVGSFDALGAFSKQESDPTRASKPFDKNRDGLVPSGGARRSYRLWVLIRRQAYFGARCRWSDQSHYHGYERRPGGTREYRLYQCPCYINPHRRSKRGQGT